MKIRKNGKVINLTESDLRIIVKKVMNEQPVDSNKVWPTSWITVLSGWLFMSAKSSNAENVQKFVEKNIGRELTENEKNDFNKILELDRGLGSEKMKRFLESLKNVERAWWDYIETGFDD